MNSERRKKPKMDKTLFKRYEEWCVKENKDPLDGGSVEEFKLLKAKEEEAEKEASESKSKADKVEKQKALFKSMCDYCGVEAEYDEEYAYEGLDDIIKACVSAMAIHSAAKDAGELVGRICE